jgi:hypothetical protein
METARPIASWRQTSSEARGVSIARGHPDPLPRRAFATVFLLSVGVLVLQIVLNRIFSFTIWYHFAYISISLALLGSAPAGRRSRRSRPLAAARSTGASASTRCSPRSPPSECWS